VSVSAYSPGIPDFMLPVGRGQIPKSPSIPRCPGIGVILPIPAKSGFPSRESKPRIPAAGQIGIGGPPGGGKSRNPAGGQNWDGGKIPNIFRTPAESGFKSGKISFLQRRA
jgi:hypothetical protein